MKSIKRMLFIMALMLTCGVYSSDAQIVVNVRPAVPRYERVVAPSPRHVWIDEEWEPRGNAYVFTGGRWAEPPHPGWAWAPGHWAGRGRGQYWKAGHWRH